MKNILQYALTFLGVAIIAMWYTGYNPFAGSGDIGKTVSPEEFKKLLEDKKSDGKRVSLIAHGDIATANMTLVLGRPYSLSFFSADRVYINHFDLYHGKGKNEFYLPPTFTSKDLKLYDNEGKPHDYNQNILLSFTIKAGYGGNKERNRYTKKYSWDFVKIRIDPAP